MLLMCFDGIAHDFVFNESSMLRFQGLARAGEVELVVT